MLDAFIIEELRRREEQERNRQSRERPVLELPIDDREAPPFNRRPEEEEKGERGVVVIDL